MTRTSTILKSAAALGAALAIGAGTAAADDGGPGLTAGTGCAVQCITKVSVHATAGTALIGLGTTVPADLTVSIRKQVPGTATDGLAAPAWKVAHLQHPDWIAYFSDLEPGRTYDIVVKATDLQGQSSTKQGTFTTRAVETSGLVHPVTTLGDGPSPCAARCITEARFWQTPPDGSVEHADLRTSTSADIRLLVFSDPGRHDLVYDSHSGAVRFARSLKVTVGGLMSGTTYCVIVRATDLNGHIDEQRGSFHTVSATALVTIRKLEIVNDGDKGRNKGELDFQYWGGGAFQAESDGFHRYGSGDVISATPSGSSREGVSFDLPADGDAKLDVGVLAEECDDFLSSCNKNWVSDNCDIVLVDPTAANLVPHDSGCDTAYIGGSFDLQDILHDTSLPPSYGTGVTEGHDGYFTFGPGERYVKILALATVDMHYHWPS